MVGLIGQVAKLVGALFDSLAEALGVIDALTPMA